MLCTACHTIDDDRIPAAPVQISFPTVADWNVYGVAGALDHRSFIRELRQPANFPYTASTFTGFGGILLVCDVLGQPKAFDLACPVECKRDVRIQINPADNLAHCHVCGSTYNVFSLNGSPVSGSAAQNGYGLRPYHVVRVNDLSSYMLVTY